MRMHGKSVALAFMGLVICVVAGCATEGMSIPIGDGGAYPATNAADVSILIAAPQRSHKVVALVEGVASTDDYLSVSRTQGAALAAMKKEAARLGANAIVLTAKGSTPYAQTTVTSGSGYGNATAIGGTSIGSGYYTATSTTMGWEKIHVAGTAVRYTD